MVTANPQPCNPKSYLVYNLDSCLVVLYLQERHGPDITLVVLLNALAGRVGDVVGLLRPRS